MREKIIKNLQRYENKHHRRSPQIEWRSKEHLGQTVKTALNLSKFTRRVWVFLVIIKNWCESKFDMKVIKTPIWKAVSQKLWNDIKVNH